jgi:hypothetical protein
VGPLSTREKGGIDDWLDEVPPGSQPRTAQDVLQAIAQARPWAPPASPATDNGGEEIDAQRLADAKQANSEPFRNVIPEEVEVIKRGKPSKETTFHPRTHDDMLRDMQRRFLGFPRRVGDKLLFDHDRDSGVIIHINNADSLTAWIGRRSKKPVFWSRGDSMVTQRHFFESVTATARRYESISYTPDYPPRPDVYYAHGRIPAPSPECARFWGFVDFFLPATEQDRCLIAAMICAPLWYIPGIERPSWIIDSRDGQNSGKTNLVELVAALYGHPPISTSKQELSTNFQQLVKRCVSEAGRHARVMLVDNVVGDFQSPELSDLITRRDITGMAPYGHGEETRPNNLTYAITANSATVGTDIADRSFYIHLQRETDSAKRKTWKFRVQAYIDHHRLEIISDIISLLSSHEHFEDPTRTRFSAFEASILQPCCGDPETYASVLDYMTGARGESNVEEEQARAIVEVFEFELQRLGITPGDACFIRSEVVNSWGRRALHETHDFKGYPVQLIRNLSKVGMLPQVDKTMRRLETKSKSERHSGIAWRFTCDTHISHLIYREADGGVKSRIIENIQIERMSAKPPTLPSVPIPF